LFEYISFYLRKKYSFIVHMVVWQDTMRTTLEDRSSIPDVIIQFLLALNQIGSRWLAQCVTLGRSQPLLIEAKLGSKRWDLHLQAQPLQGDLHLGFENSREKKHSRNAGIPGIIPRNSVPHYGTLPPLKNM